MKIYHTADWHLGISHKDYNLLDDQAFILETCLNQLADEKPDALVIAGDIYDRSSPSVEAIALFDKFISRCVLDLNIPTLVIAGNHDSNLRLDYAKEFMLRQGLHIAGVPKPVHETTNVLIGHCRFWLFPYVEVGQFISINNLEINTIKSQNDIYNYLADYVMTQKQEGVVEVLVAHAFVASAKKSDTERELPGAVGGADLVMPESLTKAFNLTLLGHLHEEQVIKKQVFYSGSIMKYSISEHKHEKSATMFEVLPDGSFSKQLLPLNPKYDLFQLWGHLDKDHIFVPSPESPKHHPDDYVFINLENNSHEFINPNAILRRTYKNLLGHTFRDLATTELRHDPNELDVNYVNDLLNKPIDQVFEYFIAQMSGIEELNSAQKEILIDVKEEVLKNS